MCSGYIENIDKQIKEIIPKIIILTDKPGCFDVFHSSLLPRHIFGLSVYLVSHSMHRYPMHEDYI